jgi:hypothetical protein
MKTLESILLCIFAIIIAGQVFTIANELNIDIGVYHIIVGGILGFWLGVRIIRINKLLD